MAKRNWKCAAKSWREAALRFKRLLEEARERTHFERATTIHWCQVADDRLEEWRKAEQQRDDANERIAELERQLTMASEAEGSAWRQRDVWCAKADAANEHIATLEGLLRRWDAMFVRVLSGPIHDLQCDTRAALGAAPTESASANRLPERDSDGRRWEDTPAGMAAAEAAVPTEPTPDNTQTTPCKTCVYAKGARSCGWVAVEGREQRCRFWTTKAAPQPSPSDKPAMWAYPGPWQDGTPCAPLKTGDPTGATVPTEPAPADGSTTTCDTCAHQRHDGCLEQNVRFHAVRCEHWRAKATTPIDTREVDVMEWEGGEQ